MKYPTLIVITGPTASGKSALAVSLAHRLSTEIVSADSRQIFKGIPIVTAVPSLEEREGVKHHLLETLPLDGYYSAAQFREEALVILNKIFTERPYAIVCGGSMLYIDALINGIDELPDIPEDLRLRVVQQWKDYGDDWLLAYLKILDPVYYEKVDLNNIKRVLHAVEVSLAAGIPYSSLLTGSKTKSDLSFNVIKFCLSGERNTLFDRINKRVEKMIASGLEEEAQSVFHLRHLNSLNTVGLKEMFAYFDGKMSLPQAIARIQKNTRVYAKKQITWHKRDNEIKYLDLADTQQNNIERILGVINP